MSCVSRVCFVLILSLFIVSTVSFAAEKSAAGVSPASSPQEVQVGQKPRPVAKRITDAAARAGVNACSSRMNQVTNFLVSEDSKGGAISFFPSSDADKRLVSVSIGLEMPGGQMAYASESFAPNQANGCDGMYETVVYWPEGCEEVAVRQFSSFKNYGVIGNNMIVLNGGADVRVFLVSAGTGCVAIKKEVLH